MPNWIQFIQQYGDGQHYALLDVERTDDGKVTLAVEDSSTQGDEASIITLRPEQVDQLKGFLNHED